MGEAFGCLKFRRDFFGILAIFNRATNFAEMGLDMLQIMQNFSVLLCLIM